MFQGWKTAYIYIWNSQKGGDSSYVCNIQVLTGRCQPSYIFKPFIHTDLQTLLVLASLYSNAAHGIIKTSQNLDLTCFFLQSHWKYKHWLDHRK